MNEFLIWNFSYNFIIIICSFLSAAICILQINQEKRLNTPKKNCSKRETNEKVSREWCRLGFPDNGALNQTGGG